MWVVNEIIVSEIDANGYVGLTFSSNSVFLTIL